MILTRRIMPLLVFTFMGSSEGMVRVGSVGYKSYYIPLDETLIWALHQIEPKLLDKIGSMPSVTAAINSACSKIMQGHSNYMQLKWSEGKLLCERQGKSLASIENREEYKVVNFYLLKRRRENKYNLIYLGGSRSESKSPWKWTGSDQPLTFKNWDVRQPKMDGKNCMVTVLTFRTNYRQSRWQTWNCDSPAIPLCQS